MILPKDKLKICFVFKGDIFLGSAPTNRVLALAGGLMNLGVEAFIYGFVAFNDKNALPKGTINSIPYSYPKYKSRFFLIRGIGAYLSLFFDLPRILHKNKFNIIYLYDIPLIAKSIIILYCLVFRIKLVEEKSEYPYLILSSNKLKNNFGKLIVRISHRNIDGIIVITRNLYNYYKQYISQKCKIEIINMTVDVKRFQNLDVKVNPEYEYFAYCGSFNQLKDGTNFLIKAFSEVAKEYAKMRLFIVGSGTKIENAELIELIKKANCRNKIKIIGQLTREEIPKFLVNAKGLILPRPNSLQAEGGFPTKLGEYLASGIPVIATKVGELPLFLIDGENAYLAEPNSVESLTSKMIELLKNPERAKNIGKNGKKLALRTFNHEIQAAKLQEFLRALVLNE